MHIKNEWGGGSGSWNFDKAQMKIYSTETERRNGDCVILVNCALAGSSREPFVRMEVTYTVAPGGAIAVDVKADVNEHLPFLPRFGFELVLTAGMENLEWFGMGPDENYADIKNHVWMAHHASTVSEQYFPYICPQEHGNHTDTRRLRVSGSQGRGLLIKAATAFEFAASHYSAHDLTAAAHTCDLKPREETFLRVDYKVSGIGTGSCGPYTFEKYRLSEKRIEYGFELQL
jgi:beta-galactosidase